MVEYVGFDVSKEETAFCCVKDAGDADFLAEIARPGFCRPVAVAGEAAQAARIGLKARCHLVRQRRDTAEHDPGPSGVLGASLSQGVGQAGRPGPRGPGRSPRLEGADRAAVVRCRDPETRDRTAGPGARL